MRRGEILAAKTLALFTYLAIVLMIFAAAGTIVGAIAWGLRPLANISGQRISAAHAIGLTVAAIAVDLVPTMALASFGVFLSVITRQSVVGVVGVVGTISSARSRSRASPDYPRSKPPGRASSSPS